MRTWFLLPLLSTGCIIVVGKETGPETGSPTESGPETETETGPQETGSTEDVDFDADGHPASTDCDDANPAVYPGAPPVCGVADANCDTDDDGQIHVPSQAASLQEAIDTSLPGGRICLEAGTWPTNATAVKTVDVTIDAVTPGSAILDGAGAAILTLSDGATVHLEDTVLTNGGLMADESSLSLSNVSFPAATCAGTAGSCDGAALYSTDSTITMVDVSVTDASVTGAELGGLFHLDDGDIVIDGLTVAGGSVSSDSGNLQGGVMWVTSASLQASFVRITDVAVSGDGVFGGAAYLFSTESVLSHWIVAGLDVSAIDEVNGTAFSLSASSASFALTQAALVHNTATANTCRGGGVYTVTVDVALANSVLADHVANCEVLSGTAVYGVGNDPIITYSDIWNNGGSEWDGFPDPSGKSGNLAVDPMFADPTVGVWDLHLGAKSPLVDAGDPKVLDDDGSTSDVGAYGGTGGSAW